MSNNQTIKNLRVKNNETSISQVLPIGADAVNVELANRRNLQETIGNIDSRVNGSITNNLEVLSSAIQTLDSIKADTAMIGSPLVAGTASEMTDTSHIYVYTGNESGYTNGNWYYYDGTIWASGGVYNSTAVETDKTLKVENVAADSRAAGNIVLVSQTQPTAASNKIWIDPDAREVSVPTMDDFDTLAGSVADLYDQTSTYAIGDYCMYEGQLYKCSTAINTAQDWTAAHWTAQVLTDNIQTDLSSKVNSPGSNGTSGQVLTTNGNGTTSWTTPLTVDNTLSQTGKAADAKKVGDEIDGLKDDLEQIGTHTPNLFDKTVATDGKTLYSNGSEGTDSNRFISDFIPVRDITTLHLYPSGSNTYYTRVVFYNTKSSSDIESVASIDTVANTVTNGGNAYYMRFAGVIAQKNNICISSDAVSEYYPYGYMKAALKTVVDSINDTLDQQGEYLDVVMEAIGGGTENQAIGTAINMSTYSTPVSNATVRFSTKKSTSSGWNLKTITIKVDASGSGTIYLATYNNGVYSYITSFNVTLSAGVNTLTNGVDFTYTTPLPKNTIIGFVEVSNSSAYYYNDNAEKSLSISTLYANTSNYTVTGENSYGISISAILEVEQETEIEKLQNEITEIKTVKTPYVMLPDDSISNESVFVDTITAIKKGLVYSFFGTIAEFSSITIGYAYKASSSNITYYDRIIIDDTMVTVANVNSASVQTYQHGLTIQNNIAVSITMHIDETADIIIMSDGVIWEQADVPWFRMISVVSPYITASSGTTLTDCTLSVTCTDFGKRVFAYGDSYFNYDPNRWMYYAAQQKYTDNMLLDAHAGEASASALKCLVEDLKHGTPMYILWELGMNDASDTGNTPNPAWLVAIQSFIAICEEKNIVPVLATIPTVATNGTVTRNNEGKNAWIRTHDYQYIDFAKAVGAGSNGVWYDGMLEETGGGVTERVHPTAKGAKALFMQACADFPQMMIT